MIESNKHMKAASKALSNASLYNYLCDNEDEIGVSVYKDIAFELAIMGDQLRAATIKGTRNDQIIENSIERIGITVEPGVLLQA